MLTCTHRLGGFCPNHHSVKECRPCLGVLRIPAALGRPISAQVRPSARPPRAPCDSRTPGARGLPGRAAAAARRRAASPRRDPGPGRGRLRRARGSRAPAGPCGSAPPPRRGTASARRGCSRRSGTACRWGSPSLTGRTSARRSSPTRPASLRADGSRVGAWRLLVEASPVQPGCVCVSVCVWRVAGRWRRWGQGGTCFSGELDPAANAALRHRPVPAFFHVSRPNNPRHAT